MSAEASRDGRAGKLTSPHRPSSLSDECANNPVGMTNEPTREKVSYRPNDVCQLNSAENGQTVNPDKAGCR
ncbi:hypothetical protein T12_13084 [Trichinella patagoniensis]|uniref:Uncharacterized protein n=1 Tax=Trichinella patagoniensis TaxID=990121 RepID=A0A0V1A2I2_9BILA|nr:hypothetical protein T12_13084 [Trichinella patagoniensis]